MNAYRTDPSRCQALVGCDRQADGAFVYGVTTTGIYCRPGCASRRPLRKNVRFFDTWQEAEGAGFRPCKRCAPRSPAGQDPRVEAVVRACQIIDEAASPPRLADLAQAVGLSPSYLHRLFKKTVGVTPRQYAAERRLGRVRDRLQTSPTVTDAVYEAGFASSSRFYADTAATLGMTPSAYQKGGQGARIRFAVSPCSLGWVMVAATAQGICAIDLSDTSELLVERLRARFPQAALMDPDPELLAWMEQVLAFLESPGDGLDLPLDIQGTAFQRRVWMALQETPPGSTASYGDIAARIGSPKAARAVAQACAANTIAVAIPCHRVVKSDGGLGGYRWGSERKRALLEREGHDPGA
jgi:AraC family transcriptional regulator, regulatory protein of adaptative response / methylated-DNA-[protein]-cysteine methyltransferase